MSSSPSSSISSASSSKAGAVGRRQATASSQCWECQRRGWVCDAARPVCHKCRISGIVCPGYRDEKPLIWLAPGSVSARGRKKRPKSYKLPSPSTDSATSEDLGQVRGIKIEESESTELEKHKGRSRDLSSADQAIKSVVLGNHENGGLSIVLNSRSADVNSAWREITAVAEYCMARSPSYGSFTC